MILGAKHRQQQAEKQHHQAQTNHNYNWKWREKVIKHTAVSMTIYMQTCKKWQTLSEPEVALLNCTHKGIKHIPVILIMNDVLSDSWSGSLKIAQILIMTDLFWA